MRKKILKVLSLMVLSTSVAFAQNQSKVNVQFRSEKVSVLGVYVPEAKKVTGLEAESIARSNGIKKAEELFQSGCPASAQEKSMIKLVPAVEWRSQIKSLGSSIYEAGALEIELSFPLSIAFKNYKNLTTAKLKSPDGKTFVFKVPSLPAEMLKCGKVDVQFTASGETLTLGLLPYKEGSADKIEIPLKKKGQKLVVEDPVLYSLLEPQLANLKAAGEVALPVIAR